MKFMLAGGGTAGHIQPALATAQELMRRFPTAEISFLGTAQGLETRLVPEAGYHLSLIDRTPLPRTLNLSLLKFPIALIKTIAQTRRRLQGVDCLIGFGGYVAAPAYLAAKSMGIAIVVHEQNAKPGFANRLGARLTPFVGVSFANTRLPHSRLVGLPLNAHIMEAASTPQRAAALAHFSLNSDRPLLLITGGSQGSQRINAAVAGAVDALITDGWQILHAVGEKNLLPEKRDHYLPLPYISEMAQALVAADLLIGRSGAVTCAEATALNLPALFVPLPIGNGEQALNAVDAVAAGGARLIPDSEFTAERLLTEVRDVRPDLSKMRAALEGISTKNAAHALVDLVAQAV